LSNTAESHVYVLGRGVAGKCRVPADLGPMDEAVQVAKILWGKWSDAENYHPLLCHLIDVGTTASALIAALAATVACRMDWGTTTETASLLALIAALHDLGKAAPAFQAHPGFSFRELDTVRRRLDAVGLSCPPSSARIPHGTITALVAPDLLARFGADPESTRLFAPIVAGHHGAFPTSSALSDARMYPHLIGEGRWHEVRAAIVDELGRLFRVPRKQLVHMPDGPAAAVMAGLVSIADWIGSIRDYFPYAISPGIDPATLDLQEYEAKSRRCTEEALSKIRWLPGEATSLLRDFSGIFPHLAPNDLQQAVCDVARALDFPALVLIEAPMGEGKTEAAMYLAEAAAVSLKHPACYFALPTQATSNQMFARVREFLERTARGEINLQLLHGHAALSAEFELLRSSAPSPAPSALDQDEADESESAIVYAGEWFTYRKRGLLAPYGVGTIDQALLAVLKTRHYFVRIFGLAGKTVIIDEVHAYDAYMSTILARLLEWLAAVGSPVILLSATLPSAKRDALLTAYLRGLGAGAELPSAAPYPRITWASAGGCSSRTVSASKHTRRRLEVRALASDEAAVKELSRLLAGGGCAAVICNTVGRAQQMFSSLKSFFPAVCEGDGEPELTLFHARYPFEERDRREKLALTRFGRPGAQVDFGDGTRREVKRPKRAVIVATQVIEQSLDLDFDVMVTDFAPVDLILQRAGRIHRHDRGQRPALIAKPTLLIFAPRLDQSRVPHFDSGAEAIYPPHLLLRSWLALAGRDSILIPEDVEQLIEFVYRENAEAPEDCSPALRSCWDGTADKLDQQLEQLEFLARQNRIPNPHEDPADLFEARAELEEENPEVHESLQALTRISEVPSIDVVIMTATEFEEFRQAENQQTPQRSRCLHWLRRSVRLAHRAVAAALINDDSMRPRGWRRSALLRHHRVLALDSNGSISIGNCEVSLDSELGIVIERPD
jgi:CRISPR-associated endonuclease/helicase Cas3